MSNRSLEPGVSRRLFPARAGQLPGWSLAVRSLLTGALVAVLAGGLRLAGDGARPVRSAPDFPCQTQASRVVAPLSLVPGQVTTATVRIDVGCDVSAWPRRLVLVVDASAAMSADGLQRLKVGLLAGVEALAPYLRKGQGLAVAVLSYDGRGVMAGDLRFSQDLRQIQENLRRISLGQQLCGAAPASDCGASAALRLAAQLLDAERGAGTDPALREMVLLASAGIDEQQELSSCSALKQSVEGLRDRPGAPLLMAACATEGLAFCGYQCLNDVASDRDFAFFSRSSAWWNFPSVFGALGEGARYFHPVKRIEFYDQVPESLEYAGGDQPSEISGQKLTWWHYPVESRFTLRSDYQLVPQLCSDTGLLPSSDDAAYTLEYRPHLWGGSLYSAPLDMPSLRVPCLVPSSTPATPTTTGTPVAPTVGTPTSIMSPSPFTPSATHTTTASPPSTAAPSVTAAITRVPRRAYLPQVLLRGAGRACPSGPRDVVLLLDVSTSMRRRPHGPDAGLPPFGAASRMAVAQRLGAAALGSLSPASDRAALVEYGKETFVSPGGLVTCCESALAALAAPHAQTYTFPWEGLARAVAVFDDAPAPPDLPRRALLLVTDLAAADLSAADQELTLAAAQSARRRGIEVLALGIGQQADRVFLRALAGGRDARVVLSRDLTTGPDEAMVGWMACQP